MLSAHQPQLDSLRAVAVTGVLLQHFVTGSTAVAPFGALGVKLFFALSGFLITGILLRCKYLMSVTCQSAWVTARRFYARRFIRLMPAFYLLLICAFAMNSPFVRQTIWWHLMYGSNIYIARSGIWPGSASVLWTLSVEEQFYVFWPWVVLLTPWRKLPTVVIFLIAFAPVFRAAGVMSGHNPSVVGVLPLSCLDTLGMGSLLAIVRASPTLKVREETLLKIGLWVGAPSLAAHIVLGWFDIGADWRFITFDLSVSACALWLIARASCGVVGAAGRVLQNSALLYLGSISYGIYLYHSFVHDGADRLVNAARSSKGLATAIATMLVAVVVVIWQRANPSQRIKLGLAFKPIVYTSGVAVSAALTMYAAARLNLIALATMNSAMYLIIGTAGTLLVAVASWELFERPLNALKEFFPYAIISDERPTILVDGAALTGTSYRVGPS
jgi:peptidoglycan/LPS O-acetylase OafA/YrhL